MKKRVFAIVAAIALVGVMAFALMACVSTDPATAKANLEAEGYVVTSYKEGDAGFQLAKAAYTAISGGEGLTAIVQGTKPSAGSDMPYDTDNVTLLYFAESSQASAFYDKYLADHEKDIAEYRKEINDEKTSAKAGLDDNTYTQAEYDMIIESLNKAEAAIDNITVGCQGKLVYFGTKAGVEAA